MKVRIYGASDDLCEVEVIRQSDGKRLEEEVGCDEDGVDVHIEPDAEGVGGLVVRVAWGEHGWIVGASIDDEDMPTPDVRLVQGTDRESPYSYTAVIECADGRVYLVGPDGERVDVC